MITDAADASDLILPRWPFPGLRPFEEDEWPVFFGRELATAEVVARLIERQVVTVHGASGAGKSSLIRAGVFSRLRQDHGMYGLTWRTCQFRPGDAPLSRLAEAMASLVLHEQGKLEALRRLAAGRDAAPLLAELLRRDERDHVCILFDQFEELFRFAQDGDPVEAQLFVDVLVGIVRHQVPGLYALVTMRSDFLGHCSRFAGLAEAVNDTGYLLPPIDRLNLLRAIREPAALYGGEVDADLADRLVGEVAGQMDGLPLVQHGLMRLWVEKGRPGEVPLRRLGEQAEKVAYRSLPEDAMAWQTASPDGPPGLQETALPWLGPGLVEAAASWPPNKEKWRLTLEDYGASTLAQILSGHADEVMAAATRGEERRARIVEQVFRALTDVNVEGEAIRRPQTFQQLQAVAGAEEGELREILDQFRAEGASFLAPYVMTKPDLAAGDKIDISHEALIRCWRRLGDKPSGWLWKEFRDGLQWRALAAQAVPAPGAARPILSGTAAIEHQRWLGQRNPAWAERYGGAWSAVDLLVKDSRKAADRLRRIFIGGAAALVVAANFAGYQWWLANGALARANQALAVSLWNDLDGSGDGLDARERNALWSLAVDQGPLREPFQAEMIRDDRLIRFGQRAKPISRALGLAWPSPDEAQGVLRPVLEAIKGMTDPGALLALAQAVQPLAGKLTSAQAKAALDPVLEAIKGTTNSDQLQALAQFVQALPVQLSSAQAQATFDAVLEAIMGTTDFNQLLALAQVVQALAGKLTSEQSQIALNPVLEAIKGSTDFNQLLALALVVQALADELTPVQADAALDLVLDAIKDPTDRDRLLALAQLVPTLAGKVSSAQAALDPVLEAIKGTTDFNQLLALALVVQALPDKLTSVQVQAALDPVLEAIKGTTDPQALHALAQAVQALPVQLTSMQVQAALDPVLEAIKGTTDTRALQALAPAVEALAGKLTSVQAQAALDPVLKVMKGATDPNAIEALAQVAQALADKLTSVQAQAALDPVLEVIKGTTDPNAIEALAQVAQALARKLTSVQAQAALAPVLAAIKGTTGPWSLQALAQAVQSLPVRLSSDQAQEALGPVLEAIKGTTDPNAIEALAQAVQALAGKLNSDQAQEALDPLLEAIKGTTDPSACEALAQAVQALAGKLTSQQADQATEVARSGMAWASMEGEAEAWAGTYASLLARGKPDGQLRMMVDALKYPATSGPATGVLLDSMQAVDPTAPGKSGGLNGTLTWLKATHPEIDLDAPPDCPDPPVARPLLKCPVRTAPSSWISWPVPSAGG